ncbi:MAG: cache domain-containing protein [Campylobacterota bacterium]|nr:cache domain-containing protein [Campylobacterota bacterium]
MKLNETKLIPYLIVIVPLVLVLSVSFFITSFYINKVSNYFAQAKENSIKDYIDTQKAQSELQTKQLILLFDYTNNRVEPLIKKDLEKKVEIAQNIAQTIYEKYKHKKSKKEIQQRIKDSLSEIVYNESKDYIFITDFNSNAILNGSHLTDKEISLYRDADNRAIILEEIQKVRKYGKGFLYSKRFADKEDEIIFVKDLGIYNWYIGSSSKIKSAQMKLKMNLLEMLKSMPVDSSEFVSLFEGDKKIYISNNLVITNDRVDEMWREHSLKGYYYYSRYFAAFDWTLVYGFQTTMMNEKAKVKHEKLEDMLSNELEFVIKASSIIILFVALMSILLSLKINRVFKHYQKEVESRRDELEELNSSLELKVSREVAAHREKDKMLTQSAKMAEMGDMLSMIAHQWRQPLNQMSYVVMNIESAYEYEELTKDYLDTKVKEANELLEFMSVTIDDFRNYFAPDKTKTDVFINDVLTQAIALIKKTLESENITLELNFNSTREIAIYKNEFIQVVLNLVKNARDVLRDKNIENPKLTITTADYEKKVIVSFKDNGGGIEEGIMEKIFEPYFSTKDEKNGTGLGLYMSKMIIEEHMNAHLSVVNGSEGAEFSVEIPTYESGHSV